MVKKARKVHNKVAGEFAELCFMGKAAGLGLVVMKPHGDSMPYDVVVDNGSRLWRVQVKSSRYFIGGGFDITTRRSAGTKLYRASELDVVAAYIVPEDVWYIIPIYELVRRHVIRLYPYTQTSRGRYHKYREAWHLLLPKPSPRRIFAQADTAAWEDVIEPVLVEAPAFRPVKLVEAPAFRPVKLVEAPAFRPVNWTP